MRAVHRALSRDLDQARPLVFIQVALQRDLLDDPLDFLADQLTVDLFGDDHRSWLARTDTPSTGQPLRLA